eukprot:3680477-Prymnesium_polylepis.2
MEIQVPLELQVVLREFTKSVLRERPGDVLEFSRDYFVEKAAQYRMCKPSPRGRLGVSLNPHTTIHRRPPSCRRSL